VLVSMFGGVPHAMQTTLKRQKEALAADLRRMPQGLVLVQGKLKQDAGGLHNRQPGGAACGSSAQGHCNSRLWHGPVHAPMGALSRAWMQYSQAPCAYDRIPPVVLGARQPGLTPQLTVFNTVGHPLPLSPGTCRWAVAAGRAPHHAACGGAP
jgi:hypothetical protein